MSNKNKNLPNLGKAYEELNKVRNNRRYNTQGNNLEQRVGNVYNNVERGLNVPKGNLLGLNEPSSVVPPPPIPNRPNLEGLYALAEPFEAGIFLDNDRKYRTQVNTACPGRFTTPAVPETPYFVPNVDVNSATYVDFISKLSEKGKQAANLLTRLCIILGGKKEVLDVISGINPNVVGEIKQWVDAHAGQRLVAVFDFDRTLSVMEGGFFLEKSIEAMKKRLFELEEYIKLGNNNTGQPQYKINFLMPTAQGIVRVPLDKDVTIRPHIPGFTKEGFANYLAGGTARMNMLQDMFSYLYDHDVKVIVLTNNTACPATRNLFREITEVYTGGRPVEIVCGEDYGRQKGTAIQGRSTDTGVLKSLRRMCVPAGGRRKTRRHIKRRQTRKK